MARSTVERVCGDDVYMISTGATIKAAAHLLRHHATDIVAVATHGPLVCTAAARLHDAGVRRVIVTDTVTQHDSGAPVQVCSVAPLLAEAIARLHTNQPLHDLMPQRGGVQPVLSGAAMRFGLR